jgi:hypothetical protein
MENYGQINPPPAITTEKLSPFRFRIGGVMNPGAGMVKKRKK